MEYRNEGYNPTEIEGLKEECREAGKPFIYIEDEDLDVLESGECVHIQFVGKDFGQEVIYDGLVYTLRLHHSSTVYEQAVEQIRKTHPEYVPPEDRQPGYQIDGAKDEQIEELLTELIEELEETEAVKVQEHLDLEHDFEYGIGIDVCLNVEEINDEVVEKFVTQFNAGTIKLDQTLYSFTSDEVDEE